MSDELMVKLPFSAWLRLEESPLFLTFGTSEMMDWLLKQELPEMSTYVNTVSLLKIGDRLYKLDGQHLKLAFLSGQQGIPNELFTKTYEVDASFLAKLTQSVGDIAKPEPLTPQDEIKLIYNELGVAFISDRISNGFISEALNIVLRGHSRIYQDKRRAWRNEIDMKKAITVMREELLLIDAFILKPKVFNTGVLAACLIMLVTQNSIKQFIVRLNNEEGGTLGDKYDPVECVLRAIKQYKQSALAARRRGTISLCQITVQAILLWMQGEESPDYWHKNDLIGIDHLPYVKQLRQIKGINEATDL